MARKDDVTLELPGVSKRPGRPSSGRALSGAERQREYRERLRAEGREQVTVDLPADVLAALRAYVARQNADVSGDPIKLGDAVERILRDRLLRKR